METKKRWRSYAKWPKEAQIAWRDESITTDEHFTKDAAEAMCRRLEREGHWGERIWFPEKTWVKEVQ